MAERRGEGGEMRRGVTRTCMDNGPVAVVGFGMAVVSTFVAFSGLAIPLPEVVYRAAAELGTIVEAADPFGGGSEDRTTPLTGGVVLTPAERAALRLERLRATDRVSAEPRATTTLRSGRPDPGWTSGRASRPISSAHPSTPGSSARPRSGPVTGVDPSDGPVAGGISTSGRATNGATEAERKDAKGVGSTKKSKQAGAKSKTSGSAPPGGVPPVETTTPSAAAPVPEADPTPVEPASPAETPAPTDVAPDDDLCPSPTSDGKGKAKGKCK